MLSVMEGVTTGIKARYGSTGGPFRDLTIGLLPYNDDDIEYFNVAHIVLKPLMVFAIPLRVMMYQKVHISHIGKARIHSCASYDLEDYLDGRQICLISTWYGSHAKQPEYILYLGKTGVSITGGASGYAILSPFWV